MSRLFRIKPIEAIMRDSQGGSEGQSLPRVLTLPSLLGLGVGTIMGAGVFVLTGSVAAECAGPSLIISFVIAAIACAFSALCYSEFSSSLPVAGSAYTYGYATLGEFTAFLIALGVILEYTLGAAAISAGWCGYFYSFIQEIFGPISPRFFDIPGVSYVLWNGEWSKLQAISDAVAAAGVDISTLPHTVSCGNWVGFALAIVLGALIIRGVELSTKVNTILVLLKLALVIVFVGVVGFYMLGHFDQAIANWTPFIPENTGEFGKFGWTGILRGAAMVFFAYIGFDCVSTAAQEAKNPTRDVPIATVGSLVICTVAYILVCLLMTGTVNYKALNVADPAARAIDVTGVTWCILFIKGGLSIGLLSGVLALIMGLSRIIYGISADGLLPRTLSKVHPTYKTPWIATIIVAVSIGLLTTFLPIYELGELDCIGTLLAFCIVCAGVLVLRIKYPNRQRAFTAPGGPIVPIMGTLISVGLMCSLTMTAWIRFLAYLAVGLVVYFTYSIKHSKLNASDSEQENNSDGEM